MRELTSGEWKQVTEWQPYNFTIELGETAAYLYNENQELLAAGRFENTMKDFDMTPFVTSALQKLTKRDLSEQYKAKRQIKAKLWDIYGVTIVESDPVANREKVKFRATPQPNKLGLYYAQIKKKKQMQFINDDVGELLVDLFFTLECYLGREEIPKTLSQYWFQDFMLYGNRRYPEATIRQQTEPKYFNYGYETILGFLNEEKVSHVLLYDLLQSTKEDKYYIMDILLRDPHFEIDENGFVVYYPLIVDKAKKLFDYKGEKHDRKFVG